ncbi:MAG: DUF2231 domain-containing protein [Dehalococcoidia bacterium]
MKFMGHNVHPMLIVFPLGLLTTSLAFDVIHLITDEALWAEIAYWLIAGGVVGGLLAGLFGLLDWMKIPSETRAKQIGSVHGLGNVVVTALFAASWFLRMDEPTAPGIVPIVLSVAGVLLALVTGWLGGELVNRLGLAVHDGAHLNSPSSLSGRPAHENADGRQARRAEDGGARGAS